MTKIFKKIIALCLVVCMCTIPDVREIFADEIVADAENTYTVSVVQGISNGDIKISNDVSGGVAEKTIIIVEVLPNVGFKLKQDSLKYTIGTGIEWKLISAAESGKYSFTMPVGNVTISAEFEAILYGITIQQEITNGTVKANKENAHMGETVTLQITPDKGYILKAGSLKYGGIEVTGNTFTMPNSAIVVSAEFEKDPNFQHSITISNMINGTVVVDGSLTTAKAGDQITLIVTPSEGYYIKKDLLKFNNNKIENNTFTMPDEDVNITAAFEENKATYELSGTEGIEVNLGDDIIGVKIIEKFADGNSKEIAVTPEMMTGYDKTATGSDLIGEKTVEVIYNSVKIGSFKVIVKDFVTDIKIIAPLKLNYVKGIDTALNLTGGYIEKVMKSGVSQNIELTKAMLNITDETLKTVGNTNVSITYENVIKENVFIIVVSEPQMPTITYSPVNNERIGREAEVTIKFSESVIADAPFVSLTGKGDTNIKINNEKTIFTIGLNNLEYGTTYNLVLGGIKNVQGLDISNGVTYKTVDRPSVIKPDNPSTGDSFEADLPSGALIIGDNEIDKSNLLMTFNREMTDKSRADFVDAINNKSLPSNYSSDDYYFDISLYLKDSDSKLEGKLNKEIEISIPYNYSSNRTYKIAHLTSNNEIEYLSTKKSGKRLVFSVNSFSPFLVLERKNSSSSSSSDDDEDSNGISVSGNSATVNVRNNSTRLSQSTIKSLLKYNDSKKVIIKGDGFTITYGIDDMDADSDKSYDFDITFNKGTDYSRGKDLAKEKFVHSVTLLNTIPSGGDIEFKVDKEYYGEKLYLHYYDSDKKELIFIKTVNADSSGYTEINEYKKRTYILTTNTNYEEIKPDVPSEIKVIKDKPASGIANQFTVVPYYTINGVQAIIKQSVVKDGYMWFIGDDSLEYSYKDNTKYFTDISSHWGKNEINFVTARDLFMGTEVGKFTPNGNMTRGMFVTVLGRLYGVDTSKYGTSKFSDVNPYEYYSPYITWAVESRIATGVGGNRFEPEEPITREQMAVLFNNYSAFTTQVLNTGNVASFSDEYKISSWALQPVKYMQKAGVLSGKGNNNFDPQASATRAEVSTVIKKFIEGVL